jgi:hypothetical protein
MKGYSYLSQCQSAWTDLVSYDWHHDDFSWPSVVLWSQFRHWWPRVVPAKGQIETSVAWYQTSPESGFAWIELASKPWVIKLISGNIILRRLSQWQNWIANGLHPNIDGTECSLHASKPIRPSPFMCTWRIQSSSSILFACGAARRFYTGSKSLSSWSLKVRFPVTLSNEHA